VTVSGSAVSVLRAAASEGALGIASSTTEFLTASAVSARSSAGRGGRLGRRHWSAVAARETPGSAISVAGSTVAILTAAGTLVDGAVGVTDGAAVGWAAGAVCRVLGLSLHRGDSTAER